MEALESRMQKKMTDKLTNIVDKLGQLIKKQEMRIIKL
jgi:hypothetical protein